MVRQKAKKVGSTIKKETKKFKKEVANEIVFNVPNSITLLRLILIFVFIYMLFMDYSRVILVIVFAFAAATDWLDGFFARRLKQTTEAGARMDQVIDRVFTLSIVLSLVIYILMTEFSEYTLLLLVLVSSREIVGFPGFLIALIRNKDPYKVKYIGKVTTFVQAFGLGAIVLGASWAIWLVIPTCIIGIFSGFDYLKYCVS
jgi:CDP-diacylglycerol--glycerol-3-phosphate 3-phosphatidyltransferase